MGFIEEGPQLIQDFVTPEIRSIDARLTAIEKKVDSFEARMEKRFEALDAKIDRDHSKVMDTLRRMETYSQILERLARLESKMQNVA